MVRDPHRYHWHDQGFRPPAFNDLVIYQLHIGTFFGAQRARGRAKFLDVLDKIDHLVRLGVNAVEPLPVDEVELGGLMSYGPDRREIFERSAALVDRIFKGAKPADLPVEQPTRFLFVLNLKTAKAMGLNVPNTLLALVDEVVE